MDKVKNMFLLLRVSHWPKSIFVLIGCFYAQAKGYLIPGLLAALAFCLISSAVYIYNDIEDHSEDSLHPHKSKRALASERVSVNEAIFCLFLLLFAGLGLGWMISKQLAIILAVYLLINVAYNHVLKLIPVFDVACIASGFILRVLAGTIGIGLPVSLWMVVVTTLLSVFIGLNKRRLEIQLGFKHATRAVRKTYKPELLYWSIVGTGVASFVAYFFYTLSAHQESFYFILTLPFAAFALWRFAWLSTQNGDNDDPVTVYLSDRLSRINLYCFIILTTRALT